MRGGTSKALFLSQKDLPEDVEQRDKVILAPSAAPTSGRSTGSAAPTPRQQGGHYLEERARSIDVDYDFGQVSVDTPIVGKTMNCGNISSAWALRR
jgi:2-methylaconitate cis-trans-isomerase PrpF